MKIFIRTMIKGIARILKNVITWDLVFVIHFANEKNDDEAKLQQRSWLIPLFSGDSPKNWCGSVTVRHRNSPQIAPA